MAQRMMQFLGFCLLLSSMFFTAETQARTIKITTFNVKWFGLGGSLDNESSDEYRDGSLRDFIESALIDTDAILFQEIVDVERLQTAVLGNNYECTTYSHADDKHQHVVFCVRPEFEFVREIDDQNFALEEITLGRSKSRPALHGLLKDRHGLAVAHIIGVHLKAYGNETATRLRQTEIIAQRIRLLHQRDNLPVITLGDFNTHTTSNTNQRQDDKTLMNEIYRRQQSNVKLLANQGNTYTSGRHAQQFDHLWVSNDVQEFVPTRTDGPCVPNQAPRQSPYSNVSFYNQNVSDHCPVTATLDLSSMVP